MKEWGDSYNSFNSQKGLTYFEQYQAINDWRIGVRKSPLPPIEVSFDTIGACQLHCNHCNFGKYLGDKISRLTDEHIINLTKFFGEWGVKGLCFGGGGESTLHTKIWDTLLLSTSLGMQNSFATNGINFNDETIDVAVQNCRWIGVSIDSGNEKTYSVGRKVNYFNKATENISKMSKRAKELNTNCDVSYKFLIFDYNQTEIYEACKLAKSLGAKDFHARPADLRHQGMETWKEKQKFYDIELIYKQFEECHKLEDENFHVYTVVHKFNIEDFTPRRKFSQCFASPICLQICPDNNAYLCPDTRNLEFYKLGEHFPDPKQILNFWGSKKHYDLVFNEGCKNCSSRCTFNPYNEQFENLFIKNFDPFCRAFV
jgi:MoaA/NifB/PqqE/SkfB family radical SAM enzyme